MATLDGNQELAPIQLLQMDVSGERAAAIQSYSRLDSDTWLEQVLKFHREKVLKFHREMYNCEGVENEDHAFGWVPMAAIQPI